MFYHTILKRIYVYFNLLIYRFTVSFEKMLSGYITVKSDFWDEVKLLYPSNNLFNIGKEGWEVGAKWIPLFADNEYGKNAKDGV